MAKKSASKSSSKGPKPGTEGYHRQKSSELHAMARLHDAKADIMAAKNPPKKTTVRPY